MTWEDASDFFFIGAAIAPAALLFAADPVVAALASFVLLIAGGVCATADPGAPHAHAGSPKAAERFATLAGPDTNSAPPCDCSSRKTTRFSPTA
jgi:hypothetical protein